MNKFDIINFEKNGFCIVKKFFSKLQIKKVETQLEKIVKNFNKKKISLRKRDINFVGNRINSIHGLTKYSKFFSRLAKNKKLIEISSRAMKARPVFRDCEFFGKPAKIGLESPFHQDNFYWNIKKGNGLTAWVCLSKSTKKNGSLKYLIGSHKIGIIDHINSYAPGSSQKIPLKILKKLKKRFKEVSPRLGEGDALFHSSEIIHGSETNRSNIDRRGLTFQFQPHGSTIDKKMKKKYLANLYKQIKQRNLSIVNS